MNINLQDIIEIKNYSFPKTEIDLSGWKGKVTRLDLIKKLAYVNLDKENLINISKEKLLEMDKIGFRTQNVEIPLANLSVIAQASEKSYIENLNERFPERIYAKTNLFSSMTIASLTLFPFLFCIVGLTLNSVHYYKFIVSPESNQILNQVDFLIKTGMLLIISVFTGMILVKGIKNFLVILKLNAYGKVVKSQIKCIYSAKRKNKIKDYIVFETINGIEIHQKIHWSIAEKLRIGNEIYVKYFDEDPKIALAINL
jgi:hypothetical protein